jgi:hypothetical protein
VLRSALTKVVGGDWKVTVEGSANGGPDAPQAAPPVAEVDPRDEPDYDAATAPQAEAADPEAEAMRLLRDQLDARPLEP